MKLSALSAIAYSATSHKKFVMSPPSRRLVLREQKVGQGEVGWYIQTVKNSMAVSGLSSENPIVGSFLLF